MDEKNLDETNLGVGDTWTCYCGQENTGKFCVACGAAQTSVLNQPAEKVGEETWTCSCGQENSGKFCVACGAVRKSPAVSSAALEPSWICSCGQKNTTKFCIACGQSQPGAVSSDTTVMPSVRSAAPAQPIQPSRSRESLLNADMVPPAAQSTDKRMKAVLIGVIVVLAAIVVFFVVRGGLGPNSTTGFSPTAKQSDDKKTPVVNSDLSLGGIELCYSVDKVHEILGQEKSQENMKEGRVRYKYGTMNVIISQGNVDALESDSDSVETKRGIHQGSTLQEVTAAYGTDYEKTDYNDLNLYEYTFTAANGKKGLLRFAINKSDDKVNYISVRIPDDPAPQPASQPVAVDTDGAKRAFSSYENAISHHNFSAATSYLTPAMQGNLNSAGYKDMISTDIVNLNVVSASEDKVELAYRLKSRDRLSNGSIQTKYFVGQATMRRENGSWLISGNEAKEE